MPPLASRAIVGGRHALRLLPRPARGQDRAGGAGSQAQRDPERARFTSLPLLPFWRPLATAMRPADAGAEADDLHERARGGLLDEAGELLDPAHDGARRTPACRRRGRARGSCAPPTPSPRAAAARSPARIASIRIFVLSRTRNVFMSTSTGTGPARPRRLARMMSAMSPPVSARASWSAPPWSLASGPRSIPRGAGPWRFASGPGLRPPRPSPDGS